MSMKSWAGWFDTKVQHQRRARLRDANEDAAMRRLTGYGFEPATARAIYVQGIERRLTWG